MSEPATIKPIYEKLLNITEEAEQIPKSGWNNFSKYNYVKAVDVIGHLRKLLIKHKVHLTISEKNIIRTLEGKNFHTIITCVATFINTEDITDTHIVEYYGVAADTLDKDIYKAKTNGLKYLFSQEFKIITDDFIDAESDPTPKSGDGSDNIPKLNTDQIIVLSDIAKTKVKAEKASKTLDRMAEKVFNVKTVEDIPATSFNDAKKVLNDLPNKTEPKENAKDANETTV